MTVQDRLKAAREAKGWSQSEMAKRLGISQQNYHPYEHARELKTGMLIKICAVLECSPNWLLGVKDEGMHLAPDSLLLRQLKAAFDQLSDEGKQEAVKRVQELTHVPAYVGEEKTAGTGAGA